MIDLDALDKCIETFEALGELRAMTKQVRGQRFNYLIADVLTAHHIDAKPNQKSKGEIDVCFRINDKRFILEAKWEQGPVNIDPIAKLGLRINQRVPNNLGVILSMNGFTQDALQQMNEAGRPNVLLIQKDIFEALLLGTVEAASLFDACLDVAAFEGRFHISLKDILTYLPRKHPQFTIDETTHTPLSDSLLELLRPEPDVAEFSVVKANLPFGQNGISISGSTVYVTLVNGIYALDNQRFIQKHSIDNPQNRCIHSSSKDRTFFIKNGSAMAFDGSGQPSIVSKRYPGHVRLFAFGDEVNLVSNGDDFSHPKKPVRLLRDISGRSTEMVCHYPISCCVDACIIDEARYVVVGAAGLRLYENDQQQWHVGVTNGASVTFYDGRIFFLERGVRLQSVDLSGGDRQELAAFDLSGSVGDFALINDHEFYFHLCYPDDGITKTCLVYLKMG